MKIGKIIPNGITITEHEYATLLVLTNNGQTVELIHPSRTKYVKSGDFIMFGLVWEMKSPVGKSSRTMEHIFRKAAHQADNLIIDLRRTKIPDQQAVMSLEKLFKSSRSVRNLWIITKTTNLVKLKK